MPTKPKSINQLAHDATAIKQVSADDWTDDDFWEFFSKMCRKYLSGNKHNPRYMKAANQWKKACNRVIEICEEQDIDPEIYIEAQFALLQKFLLEKGIPMYANMLIGQQAFKRYDSYMERNKRHGKNIKFRNQITDDHPLLIGEIRFGEYIVREILAGQKPRIRRISKQISKEIIGWTSTNHFRIDIRPRALASVLDSLAVGLSSRLFLKRDFSWKEIGAFIARLRD